MFGTQEAKNYFNISGVINQIGETDESLRSSKNSVDNILKDHQ